MASSDCFKRPTIEQLRGGILSDYSRFVLKGRPVPAGDLSELLADVFAGAAWQMQGDYVKALGSHAFLGEMCCDNLKKIAEELDEPIKPAQQSKGFVQITGTAGAVIPANISFVSSSATKSVEFIADPLVTIPTVLDTAGKAAILIRSVQPGALTNIAGSENLSLQATIANINSSATLTVEGTVGGTDEETCEQLRVRLLDMKRNACTAANLAWYSRRILEFPGVTRVCFSGCACNNCVGSAAVVAYVFMDSIPSYAYGVPPKSVALNIENYIWGNPMGAGFGKAPVGAYGMIAEAKPCLTSVTFANDTTINSTTRQTIKDAIVDYFASRACVGEKMCKSDLINIAVSVAPNMCISDVTLSGSNVAIETGGQHYKFDCDYFPVLSALNI